jgi:maltooligosyltrehalose trehalohydrolase
VLIAETNKNDPLIVTPRAEGGLGMDGQWPDDFSRSLEGLLTGDRFGYYADFGSVEHFAKAYREAFVLTGQFSHYRGRPHGQSAAHLPADRFVACVQNHDQVGNRAGSERLSQLVDFESLKLAAAAVILSPYVPLLFMGEEYGETAPFKYFIDHTDRRLCKAVHRGRIAEFKLHAWQETPAHPKVLRTFEACKLNHAQKQSGQHAELWQYYRELLRLRRDLPALRESRRDHAQVIYDTERQLVIAHRWCERSEIALVMNFGDQAERVELPTLKTSGFWLLEFASATDSADAVLPRTALLFSAVSAAT